MNFREIEKHNQPLIEWYEKRGNKKGPKFFIDVSGKYVAFPLGFITRGEHVENGSKKPITFSVKVVGGWAQRSFKIGENNVGVAWALSRVCVLVSGLISDIAKLREPEAYLRNLITRFPSQFSERLDGWLKS